MSRKLFKNFLFFNEFVTGQLLHSVDPTSAQKDDGNSHSRTFTPGHNCNRKCDEDVSKICYFEWTLEMYPTLSGLVLKRGKELLNSRISLAVSTKFEVTMCSRNFNQYFPFRACKNCVKGNSADCFLPQCVTANGVERIFMSINRQLPGPPIQICQNDLVIVNVNNEIEGSETVIHWHGIDQAKSPFMDGVPFLTQCPIHSGSSFRYQFVASQAGTFFYHSHAGHQKANGVYGAFVVKSRDVDELSDKDLPEHVVVLSDWMNSLTEDFFPGVRDEKSRPNSLLINGRGKFYGKTNIANATIVDSPHTLFHIDQGQTFKFRLIAAMSGVCPLKFQIEDHNFTVVATDAGRVKPFQADTLYMASGERFDIVVKANQEAKDSYWIRVSLVDQCDDEDVIEEFAVLKYHRTDDQIRARPVMLNVESRKPEAAFVSVVVSSDS